MSLKSRVDDFTWCILSSSSSLQGHIELSGVLYQVTQIGQAIVAASERGSIGCLGQVEGAEVFGIEATDPRQHQRSRSVGAEAVRIVSWFTSPTRRASSGGARGQRKAAQVRAPFIRVRIFSS